MTDPLGLPLPSKSHTQAMVRAEALAAARAPVSPVVVSAVRAGAPAEGRQPSIGTGSAHTVSAGKAFAWSSPFSRFSVFGGAVVSPSVFTASSSVDAPTVLLGGVADGQRAFAVATARGASVSLGVANTVSPSATTAAASVDAPVISTVVNDEISAGKAEAAAAVDAPTIDIGTAVSVSADTPEAAASVDAPSVTGEVGVPPERGTAAASARPASIQVGSALLVTVDRVLAAGEGRDATISTTENVPVNAKMARAAASVMKPYVFGGVEHIVSPDKAESAAEARTPANLSTAYPERVNISAVAHGAAAGEVLRERMIIHSPFYGSLILDAEIPEMDGIEAVVFRSLFIQADFWEEN